MFKENQRKKTKLSFSISIIPLLFTGVALYISVFIYKTEPHIPVLLGTLVAGVIAYKLGFSWKQIKRAATKNIFQAMSALIILLIIGMIIGVWIGSGIVPALIYYGFDFIIPSWFLPSIFVFCIVTSLLTGSAWTTIGTVGVAAMALGQGIGMPVAATAGAIVSGSFFGDKISPLSDSTNLTPSVLGVDLYAHIKHMLYTTVPSFVIAIILYAIMGKFFTTAGEIGREAMEFQDLIDKNFNLSPWLFVTPLAVLLMIFKKKPPIPSLALGVVLGSASQVLIQNQSLGEVFNTIYRGYSIATSSEEINTLLSRGGLESMYSVIALGIISLAFGGIMYECGMLKIIVDKMKNLVNHQGHLVTITVFTAIVINIIGANQYLAVILPGQMYKDAYRGLNMKLENLTRALEGGGTLTAPLIPWNTSGVFVISVLGISPVEYGPYALFCWFTPILVSIYAYGNITMKKNEVEA